MDFSLRCTKKKKKEMALGEETDDHFSLFSYAHLPFSQNFSERVIERVKEECIFGFRPCKIKAFVGEKSRVFFFVSKLSKEKE